MGHKPKITPQKAAAYRAAAEQPTTPEMSDRQAEAKARELWGPNAAVWHHAYSKKTDWDYFRVGLAVGDVRDLWKPFGRGRSWEAAFADAKQRGYCE